MRDPFSWSFAIPGRLFGIVVRVHILFPVFVAAIILRAGLSEGAVQGIWADAVLLMGLLFLSVLLHEFGHCFAARYVGGDASDVLLWPLGGLANVDMPHAPRAHFIVAAGGPLVNVFLCIASALILSFAFEAHWRPPFDPFHWILRCTAPDSIAMTRWDGTAEYLNHLSLPVILGQLFWVNWGLLLLNVLIIGYPLDGGRMFQSVLWPYVGYRQATFSAVVAGFIFMFLLFVVGLFSNEVMWLLLAFFIYTACKQQWIILETGGEESSFGYDFSQGYTSLEKEREREEQQVRVRQPSFFQRWRQRRAARKMLREQQRQEAEETRLDELLQKIQNSGAGSLTEEEQRFLNKVSERKRNRP